MKKWRNTIPFPMRREVIAYSPLILFEDFVSVISRSFRFSTFQGVLAGDCGSTVSPLCLSS
jgi:hypothetical protein